MSNRSRIVLGSLAGAFAIHIAALACSSNTGTGGPPDASTADAGHVEGRDGGVLDAIASVFDAVGDVVHDVATKITDGEVHDANAGGDAGGPPTPRACDCIPPSDQSTFTAAVDFQGRTLAPQGPYSTSAGSATPGRLADGVPFVSVRASASFYMDGGIRVVINCSVRVSPDGRVIRIEGPTAGEFHDGSCTVGFSGGVGQPQSAGPDERRVDGITVAGLTDRAFEFRLGSVPVPLISGPTGNVDAGLATIRAVVIRASRPAGGYLTPSNTYRP